MPTSDLIKDFRWRDQYNNFHKVQDMETRHLFYTLKMIWNHTVPEEMQLKPFKKYRLNMSKDYLKDAVSCMVTELNTRRNLELYITEIIKIENYRLILNERMFNEDLLSIGN